MARWRSGLTHIPLKDTFMGSNPIRVTRQIMNSVNPGSFFNDGRATRDSKNLAKSDSKPEKHSEKYGKSKKNTLVYMRKKHAKGLII